MNLVGIADRLRLRLQGGLPGHDAFLELSGYRRPDLEAAMRAAPPPRESAVLALLYPRHGMAHTVLMQRPTYAGVHSGQVSFPGGRREPQDDSLEATALREFTEETGAPVTGVQLIGALSPIYIPPSRSLVTPFVAVADRIGPFAPDAREVAELIEVPLADLLREDILKRREQHIAMLGRTAETPYFDVKGRVVWGATAMMLAELRELLRQ
ncbi:MAG: CoA pyrophosphatase [Flavobacteriales bacterium]|jgi:8-oxo-dGTP pyrophosphatase MutT (NUDIX family)|nr:MAG: CoA pyrophosphatase [Flavobacteriales bacterium]